jgi:TetR/AcrR family transcriptional regulator
MSARVSILFLGLEVIAYKVTDILERNFNRPPQASGGGYVGRDMVMTPWGRSSTLRERRLAPGRGTPREVVTRNQRERLFAAMVAVTAEKGYAETSVGDLVELSGVSSRTFYELFADKEECFLATMEEILAAALAITANELDGKGDVEGGIGRTARALVAALVAQPAAARLWLVEAFCAGEQAQKRVSAALTSFSELLGAALEQVPGHRGMPKELTRAILGGVAGVVFRRLARGEAHDLPDLAGKLQKWALSIPTPPAPLRQRSRRRRATGSSAPPFAAHIEGERVLRGFAAAVAQKGFAATTVRDIAAAGSISPNTFYTHFRDKRDALFAALDSSGAQMVAATLPAVRRSPQWPGAMRVAAETLCGFLAAEPAFAHLREVEVYAIGPEAVEQRDRTGEEILRMVATLARDSPPLASPLEVEATLAAVHSLLYEWIWEKGSATLTESAPFATYIALAPTLGAEAAWEAACG